MPKCMYENIFHHYIMSDFFYGIVEWKKTEKNRKSWMESNNFI